MFSNNAINFIINVVDNAKGKIDGIAQSVNVANLALSQFQSAIIDFRDLGLAINAVSAQADKLGRTFGQVLSAGMENELQKQNLTTLLGGDIDAADSLFGKIAEYGKETVYDKAGLLEAQKTMMSFGIEGNKAFSTLKNIGDIAMGDSSKMQSLALAFSQATSTGKLMGQDLMQMINAGFNPLQIISEKTGKDIAVLKDEMAKGAISADMLAQAFQWATEEGSLFFKGAEKAGKTTVGILNQLKDSVSEIAIQLFESLQPAINKILNAASKVVSFISQHQSAIVAVGSVLVGFTITIKLIVEAMEGYNAIMAIVTPAQIIFNKVMAMNPVAKVTIAVIALVSAIAVLCSRITGWGSLWQGVVGFMKNSFNAFVDKIKLDFTSVVNTMMIGLDKIKLGWYKFKETIGIGDSDSNKEAIERISSDVEARQQAIVDATKKVFDDTYKAAESLRSIHMGWKKKENEKKSASFGVNDQLISAVNAGTGSTSMSAGSSTGQATESIINGGTRSTNVTINLKDLVGSINLTGSWDERREELERSIAETMLRVLNIAQSSIG